MPRRPRLFVSGGIYHVYCKTHRGEFRFDDRIESDSFIQTVADVSRTHGFLVLAWCLMSNHYLCVAAHKKCYAERSVMQS
jgi:REP element-mobilizing transposase RayT